MKNPFIAARERKMHTAAAQRPRYRRMPIEVTVRCGTNGTFSPVAVLWPDGRSFLVDRVLRVKKMRCEKTIGPAATRYECVIGNRHKVIYRGDKGTWFVEVENGRTVTQRFGMTPEAV